MTTVGSYIIGLGSSLFLYQFCAGFPSEYKFKIKALSFTHMCWVTTGARSALLPAGGQRLSPNAWAGQALQ